MQSAHSTTPRKHVTTACKPCRESKIKCDGGSPACANCFRRAKLCQYAARDDKRRLPFRSALGILRERVQELQEALIRTGCQSVVQPLSPEDRDVVNRTLVGIGLEALLEVEVSSRNKATSQLPSPDENDMGYGDGGVVQQTSNAADDATTIDGPQDDSIDVPSFDEVDWSSVSFSPDWPWMGLSIPEAELDYGAAAALLSDNTHMQPTVPRNLPNQITSNGETSNLPEDDNGIRTPLDEVDPELIGQIAARVGSLRVAPDGQLRYFGAPTNANILNAGNATNLPATSKPRSVRIEGNRLLHQAEIGKHVEPSVAKHLLYLFYSWHNSCHPVVDEAIFWSARLRYQQGDDSKGLYSEVLENVMCAIGASHEARYHPQLVTFPRTLAEFFADRAKTLLEIELDSPCLSTVQALLLLSSYEVGLQRMARSWLYSGMAMTLALDMGLHLATEPYVAQGALTTDEARVRQNTFWASYIMNYRASLTYGRPITLEASDVQVPHPSAMPIHTTRVWTSYPTSNQTHNDSSLSEMLGSAPDMSHSICEQRVLLLNLVEPIARALYNNSNMAAKPLQELSERCTRKMFDWHDRLNLTDMKVPESDSVGVLAPQILVLHIEYHYLQILVHRPWTSRRLQPIPAQGPGFLHARKTCITSASAIARLLCIFERRFGFRRLDVETSQLLPSAALILIFASISADKETHAGVVGHLSALLRALDNLSGIFVSARMHLDSLLAIQQQWCAVYDGKRQQRRDKRGEEDMTSMSHQKRARFS